MEIIIKNSTHANDCEIIVYLIDSEKIIFEKSCSCAIRCVN